MHPYIIQQLLHVLTELRIKVKQRNIENLDMQDIMKHMKDIDYISESRPWEKLEWLAAANITNSFFHKDVSYHLREMGIAHENEKVIIPGYVVDIFLFHNPPPGSLGTYILAILLY
jgi:hypothetical protein